MQPQRDTQVFAWTFFLHRITSLILVLAIGSIATLGQAFAAPVTDRVVVGNLDRPWAVVTGPDGNIWVTEKEGALKIFSPNFVLQTKLTGFPQFALFGEGGVLDLAFHPSFSSNGWVYIAYSVQNQKGEYLTRVNRFTYRGGQLTDHKVIFDGPSGDVGVGTHFGCRLVFDDAGYLYASFGERRNMYKAQDMNEMHGKIVRLTADGGVPRDNPFGSGSPVYTLGHRNPQGLAIHPVSRRMYNSEHGPSGYDAPGGGDEINEIRAGANYGWWKYHHKLTDPGFQEPLLEYTPAIAPSGIAFYTGSKIASWSVTATTADLFVATLRGQHLLRVRIDSQGRVVSQQKLLVGKYGRLRDVATSPTGTLLVISELGKMIELK